MDILLIDAGNTRIKWALTELPGADVKTGQDLPVWREYGSVAHHEMADLAIFWRNLPPSSIARILISNVAGSLIGERLQQLLQQTFGAALLPEWFASVAQLAGIRNAYRHPAQLGCDRFATAIGAHRLYPRQALLLATCGTATTIDAISADGVFTGGMILPGLGLMANALAGGTAQLPLILNPAVISAPFADNTDDAIVSGCIAAQVGAIFYAMALQRQQRQQRQQHPSTEITCILTGGSAGVIAPYLSMLAIPFERVEDLVLTGLWSVIAFDNAH